MTSLVTLQAHCQMTFYELERQKAKACDKNLTDDGKTWVAFLYRTTLNKQLRHS